jgi:ATP-dependent DNA ligase
MVSRQGKDLSRGFPELIAELERLPEGTVIDGELVVLDVFGRPQFDELLGRSARSAKTAASANDERPAAIFAWDILMYRGKDLRALPLLERKRILEEAIGRRNRILPASHIEEQGERLYQEILALELEGIVAKRADSTYPAGRTSSWVKIKTPVGRDRESKRMERRR